MPGIPANITIEGRTPATIKGRVAPLINTKQSARGGFRAGDDSGGGGGSDPVGVIFSENFNDQPDFTSTMYSTDGAQQARFGYTLPDNWDSLYNGTVWSPEQGYPDNHASLEILSANSDKARGGVGKSAVNWRESYSKSWSNWASDSQFIKFLNADYEELYVEFYIRFSQNFYGRNNASNFISKLFRLGHYRGTGNEFSASKGDAGPMLYWDYKRDDYGVRNVFHLRGGPPGENYKFNNQYTTGGSDNFVSDLQGIGPNGQDSTLIDVVNGGLMADFGSSAEHAQVYGPGEEWTKVAFYVRMNSSPTATDGIFRQYINDSMTVNWTDIPWVMENEGNRMVGWNFFAIGGNDYFQPYPNEDRFEDWYAIDDIVVRASLPEGLL